jgi:type I restriction enzyme S subunit
MIKQREYKQTEIGRIPREWEVVRLREISLDLIGGGTPSTSNQDYWNGKIAWMTSAHIDGREIKIGQKYITDEGLQNSTTNIVPKNNLIVATRVGIGKAAVNRIDIAISQDLTGIVIDKQKSIPDFVYWYITNNKNRLKSMAQGSTIKGILRNELGNLKLPLPPFPEQQKIAEILSTVDKAIEKVDMAIAKTQRLKKGLMQELLSKGIGHEEFKDTEIGRIPKEWEVVRLEEVFHIRAGGDIYKLNFSRVKNDRYKFPIYSNSLENNGLYGYADTYEYSENCITVTGRGTLGRAIPRFEKFNAIIRLLVLVPRVNINIVFVSEYINAKIGFRIEKTSIPQLTAPKLAKYKLPLPPLPEQQRIAEILSTVDKRLELLRNKRDKLERIKKGLMNDLLTGRRRVKMLGS